MLRKLRAEPTVKCCDVRCVHQCIHNIVYLFTSLFNRMLVKSGIEAVGSCLS